MALFLSAFFLPQSVFSQDNLVRLVFAEDVVSSVEFPNTTVAKGHVEFNHDGSRLFCDSALFFQDKDIVHAYSNVQINQGDTVNLFCDSLIFDGKTNISKLYSNVRFRDNEYLMVTDSMEYDGNRSVGAYKNHAVITSRNDDLRLTSIKGYYYSNSKTFFFKDSVHIKDPEYELFSDTLEFRTNTSDAHFHGPTTILFDSSNVQCNKGIYFSKKDLVQLWNGATINEPGRRFYADSLIYNQKDDFGEGFCFVSLYDTTEQVHFLADYMLKKPKNTEIILKNNARVWQYDEKDSLYLSGDTISYYTDTLTNNKLSIVENNVNVIKGELYIVCDSAYFNEQDSILKLHKEPIMWNDRTQLFADSMFTTFYDDEFHDMKMYHNAMIITEHENDSVHYDQLKGKFMTALLDSGKVKSVHIHQNAQTMYYPTETETDSAGVETKKLSGLNQIDCNEIIVRFLDGEVQEVNFMDQPSGKMLPMNQIPEKDLFYKGFRWEINRKPDRPFPE